MSTRSLRPRSGAVNYKIKAGEDIIPRAETPEKVARSLKGKNSGKARNVVKEAILEPREARKVSKKRKAESDPEIAPKPSKRKRIAKMKEEQKEKKAAKKKKRADDKKAEDKAKKEAEREEKAAKKKAEAKAKKEAEREEKAKKKAEASAKKEAEREEKAAKKKKAAEKAKKDGPSKKKVKATELSFNGDFLLNKLEGMMEDLRSPERSLSEAHWKTKFEELVALKLKTAKDILGDGVEDKMLEPLKRELATAKQRIKQLEADLRSRKHVLPGKDAEMDVDKMVDFHRRLSGVMAYPMEGEKDTFVCAARNGKTEEAARFFIELQKDGKAEFELSGSTIAMPGHLQGAIECNQSLLPVLLSQLTDALYKR